MTPPEHLERALTDMLTGWQTVIANDPDTTDHYRERTAILVADALAALDDGATSYETVVLIVAPAFLGEGEIPAEVVEVA